MARGGRGRVSRVTYAPPPPGTPLAPSLQRYALTPEERIAFIGRCREIEAEHPEWHWTAANREAWRERLGEEGQG